MKKINLRGISEILSEKELKNVIGSCGSGTDPGAPQIKPCPNGGCSGPHGTKLGTDRLCCLLPCYGYFSNYGYGIVTGMYSCPF